MRAHRILALFLVLLLGLAGFAARAQEPSVDDIYKAASGGDLAGARTMIDQVLAKHPNSAKAHFVKAEIAARQGDAAVARTQLQIAEQLAPGLPFAKPEAVSALRSQVDRLSQRAAGPPSGSAPPAVRVVPAQPRPVQAPPSAGGGPIFGLLLLAGLLIVVIAFLRSRRRAASPPAYTQPPLDAGFGRYDANLPPAGYGGVPPREGLGSTLGRGLATGLAVGAGAVAAQEIGRRIFDHEGRPADPASGHSSGSAADSSLARDAGLGAFTDPNADMGGQDFGLKDDRGWDEAGGGDFGVDDGGGNDWDT